ncbi:PorT family protein [Ornithobacterium rhinotracheale]|uniref:porin family protein n=1 Tax=Ornithobacterium rhinotracheale TaxID=28251 RepID=UPI00129C2CA2|nr:porin family protein [Ornithobacterium rhinotracheale]MRJ08966.1 PorT family protein [Ornithobacterium rhinotracheale]UOH78864.1 PorT family protein [Ornithobacterium rhinotracheale]
MYSKTGTKSEVVYKGKELAHSKIDAHNFEMPLMLKYYFYEGANIQLGPQVSYLSKGWINSEWNTVNYQKKRDESYTSVMKKVNFAAVFGLGYKLPMGLSFDARYNLGLTKVLKDDASVKKQEGTTDYKPRVFSFSVGYQF